MGNFPWSFWIWIISNAVVDTYGHLQGSKVLGEVARVIHWALGPDDGLVRYGGDEYIVLLPNYSQAQALTLVRQMRRSPQPAFSLPGGRRL